jgi:hypothetical protein
LLLDEGRELVESIGDVGIDRVAHRNDAYARGVPPAGDGDPAPRAATGLHHSSTATHCAHRLAIRADYPAPVG